MAEQPDDLDELIGRQKKDARSRYALAWSVEDIRPLASSALDRPAKRKGPAREANDMDSAELFAAIREMSAQKRDPSAHGPGWSGEGLEWSTEEDDWGDMSGPDGGAEGPGDEWREWRDRTPGEDDDEAVRADAGLALDATDLDESDHDRRLALRDEVEVRDLVREEVRARAEAGKKRRGRSPLRHSYISPTVRLVVVGTSHSPWCLRCEAGAVEAGPEAGPCPVCKGPKKGLKFRPRWYCLGCGRMAAQADQALARSLAKELEERARRRAKDAAKKRAQRARAKAKGGRSVGGTNGRVAIDDGRFQAWLAWLCDAVRKLLEVTGPATELPAADHPTWSDVESTLGDRRAAEKWARAIELAINPDMRPLDGCELTAWLEGLAADENFKAAYRRLVAAFARVARRADREVVGGDTRVIYRGGVTLDAQEHAVLEGCVDQFQPYIVPGKPRRPDGVSAGAWFIDRAYDMERAGKDISVKSVIEESGVDEKNLRQYHKGAIRAVGIIKRSHARPRGK
jgi:hypothetical protein